MSNSGAGIGMVEVQHLSKSYPPIRKGAIGFRDLLDTLKGRRENIPALKDMSFTVEKGEWFGVLGPNGAGKTTFCDILLDITTPSTGRILVDGIDVNKEHSKTKGQICAIQYWYFKNRLSVRDTLRTTALEWLIDEGTADERIEWLADLFQITDRLDDWFIRLSDGMRVKVQLIATLITQAELLVFDEPTPKLDVMTRRKLYTELKQYQNKTRTTIIWTTHNMAEAEKTCDRIAVINNRLLVLTTPRELVRDMEKADLEEAFIELLRREV